MATMYLRCGVTTYATYLLAPAVTGSSGSHLPTVSRGHLGSGVKSNRALGFHSWNSSQETSLDFLSIKSCEKRSKVPRVASYCKDCKVMQFCSHDEGTALLLNMLIMINVCIKFSLMLGLY